MTARALYERLEDSLPMPYLAPALGYAAHLLAPMELCGSRVEGTRQKAMQLSDFQPTLADRRDSGPRSLALVAPLSKQDE